VALSCMCAIVNYELHEQNIYLGVHSYFFIPPVRAEDRMIGTGM